MKCKNIQELIITDYLDNQVNQAQRDLIEAHLKDCPSCREFLALARETVVEPFEHSESPTPPETVWQQIRGRLQEQQEGALNPLSDFIERLKEFITGPKAVPVMVTVAFVLLLTVALSKIFIYRQQQIARTSQEEIEYLAYLSGENGMTDGNGYDGYETDIEAYFL